MERSRAKSPAAKPRTPSRTSSGPSSNASSPPRLRESLGNQGLLSLLASNGLQARLAVNQPGDVYEQEADRVAQEVVSSPAPPAVQRQAAGESAPAAAPPAPTAVTEALGSAGQPLDAATRADLEPRFGRSFEDVRVHTGDRAAEAARSVDALAFTVGRDVVFDDGQYAPGTAEGKRLLSHELTHVVQQGAAGGPALLQRQPAGKAKATLDPKHFPRLRHFLNARATPEIAAMAAKLDLASPNPREVQRQSIGGATHVFEIAVSWNPTSASETHMAKQVTERPKGTFHHVIETDVGYKHANRQLPPSSPAHQIHDNIERGLFLTAESLFHELTHAQILIGQTIADLDPGFAGHSRTYRDYKTMWDAASGPSFATLKSEFITLADRMYLVTNRMLNLGLDPANAAEWSKDTYEFFVNEKFTFKTTGKRFGGAPANEKIAEQYVVLRVKHLIPGGATMQSVYYNKLSGDSNWDGLKNQLIAKVKELFKALDIDTAVTGEFLPGLKSSTESPAAPATLGATTPPKSGDQLLKDFATKFPKLRD